MIRRLFTGHHLYNLLLEEVSGYYEKQGNFKGKSLEPFIKDLEDAEAFTQDTIALASNEAINVESLKFKKSFLVTEINKRKNCPDAESLDYEQALGLLEELVKNDQRVTIFNLIIKYKGIFDLIPSYELVRMLEHYVDPFNVDQENLRYIFNLTPFFDYVWIRLAVANEPLYFDQAVITFKAMNTISNYFCRDTFVSELTMKAYSKIILENFPSSEKPAIDEVLVSYLIEKKRRKKFQEFERKPFLKLDKNIKIQISGEENETSDGIEGELNDKDSENEKRKPRRQNSMPYIYPEGLEVFFDKSINRELNPKHSPTVPIVLIEKLLSKALMYKNEANYRKLYEILTSCRELCPSITTRNMKALQVELLNYEWYPDRLDTSDILSIVKNLPAGALDLNEQATLRFGKMAESVFPKLDLINRIEVFSSMHKAGLKIPAKFADYLEELDSSILESLASDKVAEFYKNLAKSGILTEHLNQIVASSFEKNMKISTSSFEEYAGLIYSIHKDGFTSFLLNEPNYLLRVSHPHSNLNLESVLKFCIVYLPSWPRPDLFVLLYKTLILELRTPGTSYKTQLNLLLQVQEILLNDSKERPIFNYQLDSYSYLYFKEKKILIDTIHEVIKFNIPSNSVVWKYFADSLHPLPPETDDFSVKVDERNLIFICKTLWRHRPGTDIHNKLLAKILNLMKLGSKDYTQEIYYLQACELVNELKDPNFFNKDSLYYLPLCYDLAIKPEISEKLKENVQTNSQLFGEPLIKSLILAIKLNLDKDLIRNLSKGLSFYPRDAPKPDENLIKMVAESIVDHGAGIDLFVFSIFINKHIEMFSFSELSKLGKFFAPVIDQVFPGLNENLCALGVYPSSHFVKYPEIDYQFLEELADDFRFNVESLKTIIQKKILNTKFFMLFVDHLTNSEKLLDVLQGTKVVLNYLSLYGNHKNSLEKVFNLVRKFSLLPLLSTEDLLNFCFVYKFTSNSLHTNLSEFTDPLLNYLKNLDFSVSLQTSPNGLKSYPSFKYETTYEPRYLTSNDKSLLGSEPSFNDHQIPEADFLRSLKIFYLLQEFNLPENHEVTQTINSYFMMKSRTKDYIRSSFELKAYASYLFKTQVFEVDRSVAETPLNCMYEIVLSVENVGALMLLDNDMYIYSTENENAKIILPVWKMVKDFEKTLNVHIQTYNIGTPFKIVEDDNHPILMASEKKNIYY